MIEAKEITLVDVKNLKHYSLNRNNHPKEQIDRLAQLIKAHGMRDPLTVDRDTMEVITGNGTLMACKKLGLTEVPVVFQTFSSPEQRYAFSVSHNAINSWGEIDLSQIHVDLPDMGPFDTDLLGLKNFQFEPTVVPPGAGDEDSVPEHVEPKSKLGDLYILGDHRLLCGDSTNIQHVDRLMDGQKADMVFTDPPYGMDYSGRGQNTSNKIMNDNIDPAEFYNLFQDIPERYIWGRVENYKHLLIEPRDVIIWKKNNFGMGRGYRGQYEVCFYYGSFSGSDSDVWECAKDRDYVHPTQKPVELCERAIKNSNPKTVLDAFGGSGSTLIACEKTKRKCFIIELDPKYCDVIVARWEKYSGKKAELTTYEV